MNSPSRSSQRRAQARHRRQHEAHRPDEVRRHAQQHLALVERLAHQAERAVLEIAQAAVDQLGRGRRGAGGEVVLLDQQHAQAAAGGVARDPGAVDAAADDGEVEVGHVLLIVPLIRALSAAEWAACRALSAELRVNVRLKPAKFAGDCLTVVAAVLVCAPRTAMPSPRLLVIEGNSPQTLAEHVAVGGTPAHQGYSNLLRELLPGAIVDTAHPGDPAATLPDGRGAGRL